MAAGVYVEGDFADGQAGLGAEARGEFAEAIELYGQSLTQFEATSDRAEEARILSELAWTHLQAGDSTTARERFLDTVQAYEDVASKFFEHFVYITRATNNRGGLGISLWDEEDGFYYDVLHLPDGNHSFMKVRSMVGLIPLFATETLEPEVVDCHPGFKRRMQWFLDHVPDVPHHIEMTQQSEQGVRRLLSIVSRRKLLRIARYLLDEAEFLSPHGIRALSKYHAEHPYTLTVNGQPYRVDYEPAESTTGLFGGNSNWRGPVWFPLNFLLIEALQRFHYYFGDDLKVECPRGSGEMKSLWDVAGDISRRLTSIFLPRADGRRPVYGATDVFQSDPHWRDLTLFFEYFHGDNGAGIGASHQTGWTGLVAKLLQQSGG